MTASRNSHRLVLFALLLLVIFFFLSGLAAIPYVGIQADEAIFASALFDDPFAQFSMSVFKRKIPLMVMTYLGTTKAAIFAGVYSLWDPSAYSLRVPMVALGALSLPLCYLFLRRALGQRPALFATALLAFDTTYLLTTVFDWGPVAIQHICLLAALALTTRYVQTRSLTSLAGGFFFIGLGLWDKAILLWVLSGVVLAVIVTFPQILMRELRFKQISVAVFFFALGALPLIIYNVRSQLGTFRGNTVFSSADLAQKAAMMGNTLKGDAVRGFLAYEDWGVDKPRAPRTELETAIVRLAYFTGNRENHLYWPALLLSLGVSPLLLFTHWRRPVLFVLVAMAVAWAQMLFTLGAGGGAHHTILLWPFPLMLIAIAVEALAERCGRLGTPLTAAFALLLCLSAFLVTLDFQRKFITNGAPRAWSDANFALADRLKQRRPTIAFLTDWGLLDNTRMLLRSRIKLGWVGDSIKAEPTEFDEKVLTLSMNEPGSFFVSHTDDQQFQADGNALLAKAAERMGYDRQLLETVTDSLGRPCMEIFRFVKRPAPKPPSIAVPQRAPAERIPVATGGVSGVAQEQPAVK